MVVQLHLVTVLVLIFNQQITGNIYALPCTYLKWKNIFPTPASSLPADSRTCLFDRIFILQCRINRPPLFYALEHLIRDVCVICVNNHIFQQKILYLFIYLHAYKNTLQPKIKIRDTKIIALKLVAT